jgi:hypothetical protein
MRVTDAERSKQATKPSNKHLGFVQSGRHISSDSPLPIPGHAPLTKQLHKNPSPAIPTFCSHPDHYQTYSQLPFSTFYLDNNGWLCSSNSLLLWIPLDYRQTLLLPPLQLVISNVEITTLNFRNFVQGVDWVKCYQGPTP